MTLIEQQKEMERTMVERGVTRFHRSLEIASKSGRQYDQSPYSPVLTEMTQVLAPHIKAMQTQLEQAFDQGLVKGTRRQTVDIHLLALDHIVTSYVVVRTCLQMQGCTTHTLAARIAGVLQMQRQFDLMKEEKSGVVEALKKRVKHVNPKSVKKWLKMLDDVTKVEWSWEDRVKIGMHMMHLVQEHLKDYVVINVVRKMADRKTSFRTEVNWTEDVQRRLIEEEKKLAVDSPWLTPMICEPKPFTQMDDGGYFLIDHDIVKDNVYGVRSSKTAVIPQVVCDAVNNLATVPWHINGPVLSVAREAIERGCKEILPVEPKRSLPEPIEDAMWEVMTKEQRGKHKSARRFVHDHNNKLESKRETMRRTIAVAQDYAGFDAIYFPHNLDFRGRAYPLPQDLNPQGDDFTRSLLQFSEGKMVDEDAMCWIMHSCAAAFGHDKMTLNEQVEWCEKNCVDLDLVATDPLGRGYEFLCQADEPWQFLAACLDIEDCMNCWDDGGSYYSHLPIHVDGTCNGLQHLSAMGLDPVGGKAVNLMDGPRQDIYQEVADKVTAQIEADVIKNQHRYRAGIVTPDSIPNNWRGKVTRKTVKRGVMTTPYGVTPEGIRRQLIDDGMLEGVDGDRLENATYMRDRMVDAIDTTIIKGKEIMAWMQNVAKQLCLENKSVTWVTPTGFVCTQKYTKPNRREFYTLVGRTSVVVPNPNGELRASKQVNSIAPNIVHSFDAAHLMMSVNLARANGLHVGTVHDSYATHACDVPTMQRVLKSTFIDIYSEDQLDKLKQSFIQCAGRYEDWMSPPPRGDFNIREVMESTYFFF